LSAQLNGRSSSPAASGAPLVSAIILYDFPIRFNARCAFVRRCAASFAFFGSKTTDFLDSCFLTTIFTDYLKKLFTFSGTGTIMERAEERLYG